MRTLLLAAALAAIALPAAGQTLALKGPTGQTLSVSRAELAAMPHVAFTFDAHGEKHAYEGVLLIDLLAKVGTPTGKALGGKALANAVRATAADGYQAVFGLGEGPTPAPARTASSWRTRPTARRSATRTGRSSSWWKATCGPPAARGC